LKHVVYLHGFPSSPASDKAQRFRGECDRRGISFTCPDLNLPSAETATVTRMLDQAREAIEATGAGPVMLVGSSFGGFLAVHAAARDKTGRVAQLALMAPAFAFDGHLELALFKEAAQYDSFNVQLTQPIHLFQGREDEEVLPETVAACAKGRPNVDLHWYDDGHRLAGSVEDILAVSISQFAS